MRVVFLGTPQFAVPALNAIKQSHHQLVGVVCQPDKPSSRNKVVFSPVKQWALDNALPLYQFAKISTEEGVNAIKALNPDIMVTCAYGQLLSQAVIDIAPHGIINIHGSLLPHLRGASPIQHSILQGEKTTGITILQTVLKMDAGDMILKGSLNIGEEETSGELFERMSHLGAELIVHALDLIEQGKATYTPQEQDKVTFCKKITRDQEVINWCDSAQYIHNLVRALNPSPSASTTIEGKQLKVHKVKVASVDRPTNAKCGEIIALTKKSVVVACGEGAVELVEVQPQNGKRMPIASFLCGNKLAVGQVLGE